MFERYKDRANFLFVYISEAHASDEWAMPSNAEEGIVHPQPKSFEDRRSLAETCCTHMALDLTCIVDDLDNKVDNLYAAWPERMFVIDAEGRIAYAGKQGPWGFKPQEVESWLRKNTRRAN